jgi:methionyl-tRNA formyltransferase
MAGDPETAAMVMRMDEGLDTGPVCLADRIEIGPDMTTGELHDVMKLRGADLMVRALAALERGSLNATPQPSEGVTYAAKIDKAEARLDFTQPAREVHNLVRGLSPAPGAWFELPLTDGTAERVKVLRAERVAATGVPGTILDGELTIACGEGAIRPVELQRAGKRVVSRTEFLRGVSVSAGTTVNPTS